MPQRGRPPHPDLLTPREQEVLALLQEGLSNPGIADRLGIGRETVKHHVSQIIAKLGVTTREQAAAWRPPEEPPELPRPWWQRFFAPLTLAKAAGIAATLAAVAGLAVLAWGVLRTSEGSDNGQAQTPPTDAPESPGPGGPIPVGTRSFAYAAPDGTIWLYDLESGASSLLITPSSDHPPPAGYGAIRAKWSPDGRSIAYHEAPDQANPGSLRLLHFNTGGTVPVAADVRNWGWIPASKKLWYDTGERGGLTLYDVAQQTTQEVSGQVDASENAWSPDGKRLAFTRVAEGDQAGAALPTDLYLYDLASGEETLVTQGVPGQSPLLGWWSPDSRFYAYWLDNTGGSAISSEICLFDTASGEDLCLGRFTSDEFPQWAPTQSSDIFHNYVIRSDPLRAEELFPRPGAVLGWAPDGSKVAFVDGSPFGAGPRSVAVLDLARMERRIYDTTNADLAHAVTPGFYATWSGDSRYLAFISHESAAEELLSVRVADTETGEVRVVREAAPGRVRLWYNADSSALLIETGDQEFSLSIAEPDGSGQRVLAEGAGQVIGPAPWYIPVSAFAAPGTAE